MGIILIEVFSLQKELRSFKCGFLFFFYKLLVLEFLFINIHQSHIMLICMINILIYNWYTSKYVIFQHNPGSIRIISWFRRFKVFHTMHISKGIYRLKLLYPSIFNWQKSVPFFNVRLFTNVSMNPLWHRNPGKLYLHYSSILPFVS